MGNIAAMGRDLVPKRKNDTYKVIYFMQLSDVSTYTILSPLP